jgi:hypothetical protein
MGHRVAVLRDGVLQQVDTPRTLYHEPDDLFVAGFIGSPAMNLVPCATGADVEFGGVALLLSDSARGALAGFAGDRVIVGFRPDAVTLGDGTLKGITRVVEDLGADVFVHLAVDHGGDTVSIVAKVPAPYVGEPGEPVPVRVTGAIHPFDPAGRRWRRRCPDAMPRLGRGRVRSAASWRSRSSASAAASGSRARCRRPRSSRRTPCPSPRRGSAPRAAGAPPG